jgi:long-chain acyl-CoA synthetase
VVPGGGRDRDQLARTLAAVRPTVFMSVPKIHALVTGEQLLETNALRWVFTAGAPLPDQIRRWYEARGVPVYEGWGLTETSPSAVITPPAAARGDGVVGTPIAGVSVGVRAADHRIFVRGPNVMLGYFGEPEATARCLSEGVLDTGDLGEWTDNGLRLFGRCDQMVKLANGRKCSAAAIESALQSERGINHALVTSDGNLIAVIEPVRGCGAESVAESVARFNAGRVDERIGAAYMLVQPSSVENGLLTPSLKLSRSVVFERLDEWKRSGRGPFVALSVLHAS